METVQWHRRGRKWKNNSRKTVEMTLPHIHRNICSLILYANYFSFILSYRSNIVIYYNVWRSQLLSGSGILVAFLSSIRVCVCVSVFFLCVCRLMENWQIKEQLYCAETIKFLKSQIPCVLKV